MFDTGYRMLGAGARGRSREMIWGGRWEGGSGLGTRVHPWRIHVNVWQNQYGIVKQNKVKKQNKQDSVGLRGSLTYTRGAGDIPVPSFKSPQPHSLPG